MIGSNGAEEEDRIRQVGRPIGSIWHPSKDPFGKRRLLKWKSLQYKRNPYKKYCSDDVKQPSLENPAWLSLLRQPINFSVNFGTIEDGPT